MSRSLVNELRKSAGFDSPEQEVFLGILRTAEVIQRPFTELFKAAGLSTTQYNVLRILRGAQPNGLACQEIAQRMVTRDPDLTRLLDRLQAAAYIERKRDETDRRVVNTRITASGLDLLAGLDVPVRDLHIRQLRHLGADNLKMFTELLELARNGPVAEPPNAARPTGDQHGETP